MRQAMMFSKRGTSPAAVQAAIDAATVNPYPYVFTFDPLQTDAASGTLPANGVRITRLPRLAKRLVTSNASIFIATPSGNFDIAVLTSSDGGTTLTRVASAGSTAATSTNDLQTVALAVTWLPGTDYWAAVAADNSTIAVLRMNNAVTSADKIPARTKHTASIGSSFPVPASITGHTWGFSSQYYVLFD